MSSILYTQDPQNTEGASVQLFEDLLLRRGQVPPALQHALLSALAEFAQWLLAERSFDQMIDRLGEINDDLTRPAGPRDHAISDN